jgi:hypothetical protein
MTRLWAFSVVPDGEIIRFSQTQQSDVKRSREEVVKGSKQAVAQILLEQQSHADASTR